MLSKFEQFKNTEFLGDKLLHLICCELLIRQGVKRTTINKIAGQLTTTVFLAESAELLAISTSKDDLTIVFRETGNIKKLANSFEHHLYEYFILNGYEKTVDYIYQIHFKRIFERL